MNARVLKFYIQIPHEKIVDPYFFHVQVMRLFGVMPLLKQNLKILKQNLKILKQNLKILCARYLKKYLS